MQLSQNVAYLVRHRLLRQREKEALFFADPNIPDRIKSFAGRLRRELDKRQQPAS